MHHRHRLVAGMRPSRYLPQIDMGVEQLAQAQPDRQGGRKDQPGIGDQPLLVKGDSDFVGVIRSHLTGVLLPASNGRLGSAILAGQRAPVAVSGSKSQSVTGGSGFSFPSDAGRVFSEADPGSPMAEQAPPGGDGFRAVTNLSPPTSISTRRNITSSSPCV